ncbi:MULTISPECIES: alpha/beta hydrolase [unclassified Halomonas]|uniref:alpha/beta hydrolase n=1 Tax=Halomonas sp. N3-2A TaxID=2014541 RepID=UPI0012FE1908|nr:MULTISPECIES: alpha/beta hydrolase [unclassified Halomonas]UTD56371.1 alpha/beta hydrolase [Halomonas sp. MS1]
MVSLAQRVVNFRARYLEKPLVACVRSQPLLRRASGLYARFAYKTYSDMQFTPTNLWAAGASVPALWCDQGTPRFDGVILYLHGGAFTVGGAATHKHLAARLAGVCGLRAILPEYRLAPEHPFPAALDDTLTAYRALLDRGYDGDQIVLAGDSAGAGLVYSSLQHILSKGLPRPRCVVAISPFVDMELSGESFTTNRKSELMLPMSWIKRAGKMYLAGTDPADPRVSPLRGEFEGAPPSLILVGAGEVLRDDSHRMVDRLREAGATAELFEQPDVPHIWPTNLGRSPEADAAIDRIAAFVRLHFNAPDA